ncbi:hypothetical protein [Jeotgalibacillus sp. R-1-5s-1]|uniref:hypothetical protein n=1 Tax=Jeotgalibacillus sp. R-1-5s-1 TaxID=2555897 RepID=UPI00106D6E62|nr:hypothetical protein [Jeotgalibacillus sp. R-1-5s-1]TFD97075.1 hypothetical protein E2491_10315 [Jeotgalibacillus sp. R-1-5s-1]
METLLKYFFKAVNWLLTQFFGDAYQGVKKRFAKNVQRKIKEISNQNQPVIDDRGTLFLGKTETNFVIGGGTGQVAYEPESVRTFYDDSFVELPDELNQIRTRIEQTEIAKQDEGLKHLYNTHQVTLVNAVHSNVDFIERGFPILHFKKSDYYSYQATVASLDQPIASDGTTIRQKYIDTIKDYQEPSPFLSQGVGIVLTVVTSDEKIVISHRKDTGIRPHEMDVSVVEAIDPDKDYTYDPNNRQKKSIDLYSAAKRGLYEELGLDVQKDEITLLGYGLDLEYYQWNVIGTAHINLTYDEVLRQKSSGIHGMNELKKIEAVDLDPKKVAQLLKNNKLWSTAQVALYWTTIYNMNEYSRKKEMDKILLEIM